MHSDELVLGIDGGGTKTVAALAHRDPTHKTRFIGRGVAAASNPQAVGFDEAVTNLDRAVADAWAEAGLPPGPVAAAVLGLAGSDRDENRQVFQQWATQRNLTPRLRVVHDALPVLAAGSPAGWGVALICGTGSLAFGRGPGGQCCRAGGWGFLLGDEGSGYAIARAGLRAAARAAGGRGPETVLLDAMLQRLQLREPKELIPAAYKIACQPAAIAALADVVTNTADANDPVARTIVDEAAGDLASLIAAVVRKLEHPSKPFPLALTGGVLLGSTRLAESLRRQIDRLHLQTASITEVDDPVAGAVQLARSEADADNHSPQKGTGSVLPEYF